MTGYDLEIALHRRDGVHWAVELRFDDPTTETENALVPQSALAVTFDFEKLDELAHQDMDEYGRVLGRSLFTSDVNSALGESRAAAQRAGQPLRVRLFIGPSAPELHALQWETMRDPETDEPLLTDESVHFSRFLTSLDWRPAGARPKSNTRALVVVANPSGLADYENEERRLAPIDVSGEVERARSGLRTVPVTVLARQAEGDDPVTLDEMVDRLRHGFDVLYLVCHGYIAQGETQLLFEAATGGVARVAATEFVSAVRHLERTPRLVVLASCQTAGTGDACSTADAGALAPLGPRLAEAGVPAVVAMQGDISMRTVGQFMPIFFSELDSDGRIDRAAAVARWAVRNRPDWWAPALYMRLKTGRLWYSPGFRHEEAFDMWPGIVNSIARGQCTPLLGPGLTDSLIGSRQQLAQRWAGTFRFPMEPHYQDDLANVAQYLAVKYGEEFLPGELGNYLRRELVDRYGDVLTPEAQATVTDGSWDDALSTVAGVRRDAGEFDPFDALADTPFPLYLTIDPSHLLERALTRAGRTAEVGRVPLERRPRVQVQGRRCRPATADCGGAVRLPPVRPADRPRVAGAHRGQLPRLPHGHHRQPHAHPRLRDRPARPVGAAVPRVPARRVGVPRAVPQPDEPGGAGAPAPVQARRRADRPRGGSHDRTRPRPSLPRELLRREPHRHLLGAHERLRARAAHRLDGAARVTAVADRLGTNPYVGPRAFTRGETLYGRDREVLDLIDLVVAERIVLLYSPSGAGKTSLLQAALIPALEEQDFVVPPIMRVGDEHPGVQRPEPAAQPLRAERAEPPRDRGARRRPAEPGRAGLALLHGLPRPRLPPGRRATSCSSSTSWRR